ncbi:MAG: hypothetical protein IKM93_08105 [Bacteroidales bacterium]|nr:hypothetical protein [Bacteroidales bacterium]
MLLNIIAIVVVLLLIIEILRLFGSGNAGGLAETISRPLLGIPMPGMLIGLAVWLVELYIGYWAIMRIWHWIIG